MASVTRPENLPMPSSDILSDPSRPAGQPCNPVVQQPVEIMRTPMRFIPPMYFFQYVNPKGSPMFSLSTQGQNEILKVLIPPTTQAFGNGLACSLPIFETPMMTVVPSAGARIVPYQVHIGIVSKLQTSTTHGGVTHCTRLWESNVGNAGLSSADTIQPNTTDRVLANMSAPVLFATNDGHPLDPALLAAIPCNNRVMYLTDFTHVPITNAAYDKTEDKLVYLDLAGRVVYKLEYALSPLDEGDLNFIAPDLIAANPLKTYLISLNLFNTTVAIPGTGKMPSYANVIANFNSIMKTYIDSEECVKFPLNEYYQEQVLDALALINRFPLDKIDPLSVKLERESRTIVFQLGPVFLRIIPQGDTAILFANLAHSDVEAYNVTSPSNMTTGDMEGFITNIKALLV